jgi:hypothetical protein
MNKNHMLQFKVGDTVRIINDAWSCSHDIPIGEKRKIISVVKESRSGQMASDYQEYELDGGVWVAELEIEKA